MDSGFEKELMVAGGKDGGRASERVWVGYVHTGYLKWKISKDLLYSTGNSAQYYVAAWMGREFGREWIYIYWIYLSNLYM